jgi:thiol-disulfide isomerase/thioredoxin
MMNTKLMQLGTLCRALTPYQGRQLRCVLSVVSLLLFSGCSSVSKESQALVGLQAPYVRFTLLDGEAIPLEATKGKTTAILFWTTWCGHSRGTIEEFEALAKRYKRRKDVVFLAASLDRAGDLASVKGRIKSQGLSDVAHAFSGNDMQDEAFLAFKGDSVPYIVVVDPRGVVQSVANSTSALEDYLEERFG